MADCLQWNVRKRQKTFDEDNCTTDSSGYDIMDTWISSIVAYLIYVIHKYLGGILVVKVFVSHIHFFSYEYMCLTELDTGCLYDLATYMCLSIAALYI